MACPARHVQQAGIPVPTGYAALVLPIPVRTVQLGQHQRQEYLVLRIIFVWEARQVHSPVPLKVMFVQVAPARWETVGALLDLSSTIHVLPSVAAGAALAMERWIR